MENEFTPPSLKSLKERAYQQQGELYQGVITGEVEEGEASEWFEETSKILNELPEQDALRIEKHSKHVVSLLPDLLFQGQTYVPTSRDGLKALIASAYLVDSPSHDDPDLKEMYIRALSALSGDTLYFSNNYQTNTEAIISGFFKKDFSRRNLLNLLSQIEASTMPVSSGNSERRNAEKVACDIFIERTRQKYHKAMDVFAKYHNDYFPENAEKVQEWKNNITFVNTISRLHYSTNDPDLASEALYCGLAAGAVAFGVDSISGLPLTVTGRPYDYEEVANNPDLLPRNDPSFKETLTLVHENVHNAFPNMNFSGDWMNLMNELLTDSTAWIITLESHDQDFEDWPKEYRAFTGYFDLVVLARSIVGSGLISKEKMVEFGMHQDPQGFLKLLSERLSSSEGSGDVESIFTALSRSLLIKPRKEEDIPQAIEQFKADAGLFLQNECMDMWKLVGNQYMGQKLYLLSIFERYKTAHPDVGENDYGVIRNEQGRLTDEAVDIFYALFQEENRYRSYLLGEEEMLEEMDRIDAAAVLGNFEVPEHLKIRDSYTVLEVLRNTNVILSAGLDYHVSGWTNTMRYEAIVNSASEIYHGIVNILEKNWSQHGIPYTQQHVLRLMDEVIPNWLSLDDQVRESKGVVTKVLQGVEALTAPTKTSQGAQVLDPEQVFYWGSALNLVDSPNGINQVSF